MEQEQVDVPDITQQEQPAEETPAAEEVAPTKSVKNFWERLDEVFTQNTEFKERMEELLEQFPTEAKVSGDYKSFIFQPERISVCSNDDISVSSPAYAGPQTAAGSAFSPTSGHFPSETFSSFRIRLRRPIRNIKSIQLLSAVIPNALQNIPDYQVFFFYYRLRSVALANRGVWAAPSAYVTGDIVTFGINTFVCIQSVLGLQPIAPYLGVYWKQITLPADTTRPNYYDLNPDQLQYVFLMPTYSYPADFSVAGTEKFYNRRFQDYNDIVTSLNYCMAQAQGNNSIQNDISFQYNENLNKIIMVPNPANITAGYYYLPAGFEDPNITTFMTSSRPVLFLGLGATAAYKFQYIPGYTLNLRLGFTWNGLYTNPVQINDPWSDTTFMGSLYWYLRVKDPGFYPPNVPNPNPPPDFLPFVPNWGQNTITFNNYGDLVNTSCVRVYADFALGSTQDSLGSTNTDAQPTQQGLLSIVPVNATNLGVGFYQNNFNNELTKIPQNLTEIGITMLNDQGQPFYLPNSATVLLELGITYH